MATKKRKERRKALQSAPKNVKQSQPAEKELDLKQLHLAVETANAPQENAPAESRRLLARYRAYRDNRKSREERKRPHHKRYALLGIFCIIFTVIGLIASVRFCIDTGRAIADKSALKEELMPYVSPYVVIDAPEFSEGGSLSETVTLRCAAWDFLLSADISQYAQDGYGNVFVPRTDLQRRAAAMFGREVELQKRSDYGGSLSISYDSGSDSYLLPLQPDYATYYPKITAIEKQQDGYKLTVQYLTADFLSYLRPTTQETVVKTMSYTLLETEDDGYRVSAITLISIEADGYYQPDISE